MKLSDIKGPEALDLLVDLIEPATVIMADPEAKAQFEKSPLKFVKFAVKQHRDEVMEILAILSGESVEEFSRHVNLLTVPKLLLDLVSDKELMELFTSQGQMGDATSSGSASANKTE